MTEEIEIPIVAADKDFLPVYASDLAAGADVKAYVPSPIFLEPGAIVLVPTGLRFAIPKGYEIQIRPRSGLALKYGITVLNSPGTIDADYRGEVGVILINLGKAVFEIAPGMRIAQIVVAPVLKGNFVREETLVSTVRGEGGFGHTGTH
ncbi:MAG TPA: dUTP diphosphatase [Rhabdochlamydiaceae bacterium]|jgi:dUTP pyrophosphatase